MYRQQSRSRRLFPLVGLSGVLALATFAVYREVGNFGFIIMDDYHYVLRNPSVAAGLTRQGLLWALTSRLLALGAYLRHVRKIASGSYLAVIVLLTLSLAAKPMFVTLPVLLILLDYWPLRRGLRDSSGKMTALAEKLPLVGIFLVVAWGVGEIAANRFRARCVAVGAFVVLVALGSRAQLQTKYWVDSVTLFRKALEAGPPNAISENNLGYALDEAGDLEAAIAHFRAAVHMNTNYDLAQNNLGAALGRLGLEEEAIDHFREAVRLNPDYAEAHNNLGYALVRRGRIDEGIGHYRAALARQPGNMTVRKNLEDALEKLRLELP